MSAETTVHAGSGCLAANNEHAALSPQNLKFVSLPNFSQISNMTRVCLVHKKKDTLIRWKCGATKGCWQCLGLSTKLMTGYYNSIVIQDRTVQYRTGQDTTVQYSTIQYSTGQDSTVQYSTGQSSQNLISSNQFTGPLYLFTAVALSYVFSSFTIQSNGDIKSP